MLLINIKKKKNHTYTYIRTYIHILLGYLFTVTTYKFEIRATILITNNLLIYRVQFMEIAAKGNASENR